jgi:hypothetical protein
MKVKDLIKLLQEVDPELEIISPKDDEGNGWRWPDCVDDNIFVIKNELLTWEIEDVYTEQELDEEENFVQVCYLG